MSSLNKQMAQGALWMALLRLCVRGIGLLSTVILARLLVPADFGLVAMATSIIAFLQLATAFSFDIPLIQKQDAGREYFDSAWTMNVLFYAALTVALILLAQPAATFYEEPRLVPVIYVLAAGFFVQGYDNIGIVYFRKELNFKKDFVLMLSKKMLGFIVTIPLAFYLRSYWALIAGMVFGNILGVALSYMLHPFRPRFTLAAARELYTFSRWLMLNNVINFLRNRSPDFIIGRISGTSALGLFTIAHEIATLPTTELVAPINRAVFPGYSKLSADIALLRQSYLDVLIIIALIALPAGFGLAAVAEPAITLLLGDKWLDAIPLVVILAIYGGVNSIQTNTGSVFNALGKPFLITWIGVIATTILLSSSIALAIYQGPIGIAYAYLGTATFMAPITFYYVCRETQLPYRKIVAAIAGPFVASIAMYYSIQYLRTELWSQDVPSTVVDLVISILTGACVYTALIFLLWLLRGKPDCPETRLVRLLKTKVQNLPRR